MNPITIDTSPTPWVTAATTLSRTSIEQLLNGEIPAIHIRDFASADECERFCQQLEKVKNSARAATTSPMQLIGSNFANYRSADKNDYFASVDPSYRILQTLTETSFDPLQRMLKVLREAWPEPVNIASESGYGRYFAGGVKTRNAGSALHFDYVPLLAPDYQIGQIVDQFSWNLYLAVPTATGATTVYNAPVQPQRASTASADWNNLIDPERVKNNESHHFQPQVGEAVLFNTRYPHTIEMNESAASEKRTQIGSFIGRLSSGELILWS